MNGGCRAAALSVARVAITSSVAFTPGLDISASGRVSVISCYPRCLGMTAEFMRFGPLDDRDLRDEYTVYRE